MGILTNVNKLISKEENAKGIDLKASTRAYKDSNNKCETMIVFSEKLLVMVLLFVDIIVTKSLRSYIVLIGKIL